MAEKTEFQRTTQPEAQWFPQAGMGLFMHWGIHSVAAVLPLPPERAAIRAFDALR